MPAEHIPLKLAQFLPFRLQNIAEGMSQEFAKTYRRQYNMTRPEWRTFANLGEHEQLTAKDIGQLSHMHKTKVSRAIASLTKRGWLKRSRDEHDRRIEHLTLTAHGKRHYAKLIEEANQFNHAIETQLGTEAIITIWKAIEHLDELRK